MATDNRSLTILLCGFEGPVGFFEDKLAAAGYKVVNKGANRIEEVQEDIEKFEIDLIITDPGAPIPSNTNWITAVQKCSDGKIPVVVGTWDVPAWKQICAQMKPGLQVIGLEHANPFKEEIATAMDVIEAKTS